MQKESDKRLGTLSYSYGRALQASALKAWSGDNSNAGKAQEAFIEKANSFVSQFRRTLKKKKKKKEVQNR